MRKLVTSRRLVISALTLVTLLSVVVTAAVIHTAPSAKAVAPAIRPHTVNVHPVAQAAGKPDASGQFLCQSGTYPYRCYGPTQFRNAYAIDPLTDAGLNGQGRTIVIVDAFQSPTLQQDFDTFNQTFHMPSAKLNVIAPDGLTPFDANDPNQVGWAEEISLDVQWAHAIAPRATIDLVLAKSNQDTDILSATKYAVDHNLGDVISQSFGEAESCVDPALLQQEHEVFAAATRKGITLLASSGDQGASQPTCDGSAFFLSASSPASDPLVTAVGGTQLNADLQTGKYISETAWNETDLGAATGGGYSTIYSRPGYQNGTVKNKGRGVPDVALDAAVNGGVLVALSFLPSGAQGGPWHIFGGTSASSPEWAGLVAISDQIAGKRLGFINSALYKIGNSQFYSHVFHDITSGNNTYSWVDANNVTHTVQGYNAGKGWDATTGWGTPIAVTLLPLLVKYAH